MSNRGKVLLVACLGFAAGVGTMRFAELQSEHWRDPRNVCKVVGTMPPRIFISHNAVLTMPELTGFDCEDSDTIHWRATE